MHISAKIDLKKYILLSSVLLAVSYYLSRSSAEFNVMIMIFLAACINQYMLVKGVEKVTNQAAGQNGDTDKSGLLGLFIGKAIVLIVALVLGVQIMGKRIIIPVLIYVLQIVVLYFSMKKPEAEQGSNK